MLYTFLWWVLKAFILLPFRVSYLHAERVPASGGVVIAGNHESYLDPLIIALGVRRRLHFMAKAELWRNKPLAWLVEQLQAFPVHRGTADRAAIQTASRLLEEGGQVGIFPQGTRHHASGEAGFEEGAGGAALIAQRTGSLIVPVGINGTDRVRPKGTRLIRFPKVTVCFGEPIDPSEFTEGGRRERVDAITARIMEGIAAAHAEASGRKGGS
jgi:1-acyl-sn-glycerol-3-phosphate acyltransferase